MTSVRGPSPRTRSSGPTGTRSGRAASSRPYGSAGGESLVGKMWVSDTGVRCRSVREGQPRLVGPAEELALAVVEQDAVHPLDDHQLVREERLGLGEQRDLRELDEPLEGQLGEPHALEPLAHLAGELARVGEGEHLETGA